MTEKNNDVLLLIPFVFGLIYASGLEDLPIWFRLVTVIMGATGAGVMIFIGLFWVVRWVYEREERKNK